MLLSLFHFFLNTDVSRPKAFFRVNSTHKLQSLYTNGKHDAIMCVWINWWCEEKIACLQTDRHTERQTNGTIPVARDKNNLQQF